MDNNVENNINSEFNGLTAAEVNARIEAGKINIADDSSDRTTGKIIRDNLLTYFNLIFLVITVLLCIAGAIQSLSIKTASTCSRDSLSLIPVTYCCGSQCKD